MDKQTVKSRFKIKYIFFGLLLLYIVLCQSCMTMRMTTKETNAYFEQLKVPFTSKTISVANHQLHYLQTGNPDKPTLFFVHGSPGSWDAYKSYLSDTILLRKYRMIAIDRPGFGYSDFGDAQDLPTQAALIEKVIEQVDNRQPVVLVGHSLGGPVIVKMATDMPQKFKHLVVLAGSVDPRMETAELWRNVVSAKPIRYLVPGALRPSNDELILFKQDLYDMAPDLKKITSDVTIIHGTKDPLVPYGNVAFMQKKFVNVRTINVIAIENANHFIPWEHFELIRNTLANLKL